MIPSNRIDPKVVSFLQSYAGAPNLTGDPVHNAIVATPITSNSGQYNGRIDQQIGVKDNLFFGWSQIGISEISPRTVLQSRGMSAVGRTVRAGWNHTFTPSLILEARGGFTGRPTTEYNVNSKVPMSTMVGLGFTSPGGSQISLSSPWGSYGIMAPRTSNYPSDHVSGNLIWVHGKHNFKFGVQYIHHGSDETYPQYAQFLFGNELTNNPELAGTTGSSLASALLGFPRQTIISNIPVLLIDNAPTWGEYGQDEWKLRSNVTLTYGLRFDHRGPYAPNAGNFVAGFVPNGDYWIGLNQMPGLCSTVGKAPCLPAPLSQIPYGDHIKLSPYGTAYGPKPEWDEWGPRLGIAWRVNPSTVVRGGYGIVYDPLTGLDQDWMGIVGGWPAAGGGGAFLSWNQTLGQPLTTLEQTFGRVGVALPDANPWNQSNDYIDPYRKDARSQQWNLEVQRQMGNNLALSIGYVGSYSDRLDQTVLWNTATTPGPGTVDQVNALRPFPGLNAANIMGYSTGNANYNALEVKLERRFAQGLYYLLSYTWSKSIDLGTSGWFAAENGSGGGVQNAYDPNGSRSVSAYDVPQYLSMAGIYDLPFGTGKKYFNQHGAASRLLGNWQLNSIVQLRSGVPYSMSVTGDVANIGNTVGWWNYARPNLVGDPHLSNPTSERWFNPAAFAVPSFSYGNVGRDTLRSAPAYTADFSLFKNFVLREGTNLSFRAEFFNIFNIQNYAAPDALVGDPAEGRVTSNVSAPRQIQLGLRLTF
jgi:hypothetical protein